MFIFFLDVNLKLYFKFILKDIYIALFVVLRHSKAITTASGFSLFYCFGTTTIHYTFHVKTWSWLAF